ncbi:DUF6109 family natural product biosynthesis protein, partial [Hyalangium sp.]|uniref:DUF6109 family natural product biosynthesis protein n=1 Tax=Hyalangium sp. TaxID=2028555 RepID=UPI002D3B85C9
MARHDREERQHRRWLEDAQKHLGRGDLEGALPALLRLPQPLRDELLPRAAVLFRELVHEQHRRGAWGMLGTLAARADAEPGLVARGVDAEEARAAYWPLMWAVGRTREWARAQRLWQPLAATVRERAPRLAVAVDSWLSTQGAPLPEAVGPALACLPPLDSRLGVEPARPRATLPPPRSGEEVEGALLALCALEPFPVFASRVEAWAREATAEVARGVWELAGQLAARELWLRAAADKGLAVLSEPASLLARAAREAGASQALSALALEALRVVSARLPQTGISRAEEAEAWCALAQAAALQEDARPWVVQAVSEVRFSEAALPRALRLYEALLASVWDAALWARAFLAWDAHHPEARIAPMWLQEGLRRLIASGTPAFLAWMRTAAPTERTALVESVASTSAPDLVESWMDACWEGAEEELRHVLSEAILVLLDRTRDKNAKQKMERMLRGAQSQEDAAQILLEAEGVLEEVDALMVLPPEGLRIWRRFGSRVLTYRVEFLLVALRHASSDSEAWEIALRYLDAHEGDSAYIETLQTMDGAGREELSRRVLARWMERRANDVEALAEAAVACGRVGAPCKYIHPVLEAFLLAQAGQPPPAVPSAAVKQAQVLARDHHLRLRKRKPSGKKKKEV